MKYLLLATCFALSVFLLIGCGKDDDDTASHNRILLQGNWNYVSAYRSATYFNTDGTVRFSSGYNYTPLNPSVNHLTFMNDGTVYSFQEGWGQGVAGSLFRDTVHYEVKDKYIIFYYPAGINQYYFGYPYPAYQDTLFIKFLSADSLSFTRIYHYKHLADSTELKESSDQLRKE